MHCFARNLILQEAISNMLPVSNVCCTVRHLAKMKSLITTITCDIAKPLFLQIKKELLMMFK